MSKHLILVILVTYKKNLDDKEVEIGKLTKISHVN